MIACGWQDISSFSVGNRGDGGEKRLLGVWAGKGEETLKRSGVEWSRNHTRVSLEITHLCEASCRRRETRLDGERDAYCLLLALLQTGLDVCAAG